MSKTDALIDNARYMIDSKYASIVQYDVWHQIATKPVQLTTKELKLFLLEHGEYVKITASGHVWVCAIHKKSLGAGVYSVWLSIVVVKHSVRQPMPAPNHN